MSYFVDKLRLREMAEEDIYFARLDLELIDALQKRRLRELAEGRKSDGQETAKDVEYSVPP